MGTLKTPKPKPKPEKYHLVWPVVSTDVFSTNEDLGLADWNAVHEAVRENLAYVINDLVMILRAKSYEQFVETPKIAIQHQISKSLADVVVAAIKSR